MTRFLSHLPLRRRIGLSFAALCVAGVVVLGAFALRGVF